MSQKQNVTIGELISMDQEINGLSKGMHWLMRSKVREFNNLNGLRITSAKKKMNALIISTFEMDRDNAKLIDEIVDEKPTGKQKPVFQEGKTMEEYQKQWNDLMAEVTVLEV